MQFISTLIWNIFAVRVN